MRFSIEMSVKGEMAEPAAVVATAQAAERSGYAMLGYTDHPAPSNKWLVSGGHPSYDPFAALCYLAAVTTEIRLMTYLAVLPYRNPFLLAKSVATVDRLSGGRFTLVVGTGYLRSEFEALGEQLDDRNDRFEETIDVLRGVYRDDDFTFAGRDFASRGVVNEPKPVQLPHPPIWIGGSSRASRKRVARYGDGWSPLTTNDAFARTVRTGSMSTNDEIAAAVDDLRSLLQAEGRDPMSVSIQLDGFGPVDGPVDASLERVAELAKVGITHLVVRPPAGPAGAAIEALESFGAAVVGVSA